MSRESKFGVNVWWTCPEVVTDGVAAQAVMTGLGFDPKVYLPLPSRRAEFSRGVYSLQNQRGKLNRTKVEPVADTPDHVALGILECAQSGVEEAEYTQKTKAVLDKASGVVRAEGKLVAEVLKAVDAYSGKVTDEDLRSFLRHVINTCYGVAKRPSGGIYFVPAKYADKVEAAESALAKIGTGARIYVERVQDGKEERANVWEAVESDVISQIEERLEAVERIDKRVSAMVGHQSKLEELSELVEVYKGLLGEEAKYEGVAERIEVAVKVVAEKMEKLQKGTAASVPVPVASAAKAAAVEDEDSGVSVPDAAWMVLSRAGRAMTVREMLEEVVRQKLYVTDAGNPLASFSSVLNKSVAKGEKRIVRTAPGTWGLAA